MQFWIIQTLNSVAFGGLLFLLSSGFSLIFGLMRIPNLAHGAFFMLGVDSAATPEDFHAALALRAVTTREIVKFVQQRGRLLSALVRPLMWLAVFAAGFYNVFGVSIIPPYKTYITYQVYIVPGLLGIILERFFLRQLAGNEQGQVLVTLGISFIIADICLWVWTGDPVTVPAPSELRAPFLLKGFAFPTYRLVVLAIALAAALLLYLVMERTRLGAMIRAGVDDMEMARGVGIPVSLLFTVVFLLGATLAGAGGLLGGPMLNAYPGLDTDMLPLALIVVILGGAGSLLGAFVGSFIVGFLYNFGIALFPDFAYFILFLPMLLVLVFMPQGLFGRVQL